ncbi:MAG: hypothetical protein GY835_19640 [bacterium]|nr:hypothetical protein [bacterium]
MSTVDEFIRDSDNASDYADDLIAKLEQSALEDLDDLYNSDGGRDEELWNELGVNPELVVKDYNDEPTEDRGLEWVEGLAGISAAAATQFFLDNREETIVKPVAYREQVLSVYALSRTELIQAGKRGVEVIGVEKFQVLQARYVKDLAFISEVDSVTLYQTLYDYGAIRPIEKQIADAAGYVARMTEYRPGSTQFTEAVNDLINRDSKRVLKQQNRRAVERVYSFRSADGDMDALMAWIGEGGKNTCSYCLERFGRVQTYQEWIDEGLPGSAVCKGGDACQCHLERSD